MSELRTVAHYQRQALEALQIQVERQAEQLAAITGDREKAMITLSAGGVDFPVMYEFEDGEAPIYDINSPVCGPGADPSVTSMEVWINGGWMDADVVMNSRVCAQWRDWIVEHELDSAREQRDGYLQEKADQARQDRIERDYK
jgi:hypothetical protein